MSTFSEISDAIFEFSVPKRRLFIYLVFFVHILENQNFNFNWARLGIAICSERLEKCFRVSRTRSNV